MNTKILIGTIIGTVIIISGIIVFWYIPSHSCPESCDDGNSCTQDVCSKETNYKCFCDTIPDCCGNKICETVETYETCSADCPNCDDDNKCTKDHYDYYNKECVNRPILDIVCCGNSSCEVGETYHSCSRDCPNCEDDNKCTKDKYDYHQQKCLNEIIKPCCGNGLCDKGSETLFNCPKDCPSCDDSSKLTSDGFNYTTQKCENTITHYFIDDFESGTESWDLQDPPDDQIISSWTLVKEGANTVLKGKEHNWGVLSDMKWDNFIFKVKFKIIKGEMHFNYRLWESKRYFIRVANNNLGLSKQIGDKFFDNILEYQNLNLTPGWHNLEIRGYDNILNILIDDKLLIKYKDTQNSVLSGGIGIEVLNGSEFLIDDVEIKVITQQNVIYP